MKYGIHLVDIVCLCPALHYVSLRLLLLLLLLSALLWFASNFVTHDERHGTFTTTVGSTSTQNEQYYNYSLWCWMPLFYIPYMCWLIAAFLLIGWQQQEIKEKWLHASSTHCDDSKPLHKQRQKHKQRQLPAVTKNNDTRTKTTTAVRPTLTVIITTEPAGVTTSLTLTTTAATTIATNGSTTVRTLQTDKTACSAMPYYNYYRGRES